MLLDLDKFAAGEPMLDVTKMLMPLRRERKTRLAGTSLARVFAEEYFAHVPADGSSDSLHTTRGPSSARRPHSPLSPGKNLARGQTQPPSERREQRVDVLVEEARAMLADGA